ncbi:Ig-like domain-containing protein [Streptomyces lavendulae]|uniref:L,D-transpeptidase n=1 Tax=Streptomyces lavendulae TaxID=1914 RepID=UPI003691288E
MEFEPGRSPALGQGSEAGRSGRATRRRFLVGAATVVGGTLGITACGSGGEGDGAKAVDDSAQSAAITITPADGTVDAGVAGTVVTATRGTLTEVTVVAADKNTPVKGSLSADKKTWKPDSPLERATTYKVVAKAGDQGDTVTEQASFTTVSAAKSFLGTFTPDDGAKVGVGMPVSITFDKPIKDKRAVGSALKVTCSSGQQVVGHWFSDTRIDFRPKEYWEAGSTVTLELRLADVEASSGIKGIQQKTVSFSIARSQVSTVDVDTCTMTVVRDGQVIKTIPISAGSKKNPTYNGQMVISEKHKETRMDGATVGFGGEYDIPDVPHAMRLSTSGTFIHGNYWSSGVFGRSNTSHGCIGLSDAQGANDSGTPGAWFYENSVIGDVVVVKNSPDATIRPDNGLNGWNLGWNDWVKDGVQ